MRLILVATLMLMTALAGCSGGETASTNPSGDQNATVTIRDSNFNPSTVNVRVGSVVEWKNEGAMGHTVTANDGSIESGTVAAGKTFTHTFNEAGTVAYKCRFHAGMTGTINVQA